MIGEPERASCSTRKWLMMALSVWSAFVVSLIAVPSTAAAEDESSPPSQKAAATEPASETSGRDRKSVDHADTLRAVTQAQAILDRALAIDKASATYDNAFVLDVVRFYRYGTGSRHGPSDPVVTRKFCREFTIALLRDLFSTEDAAQEESEPDPSRPQNPLDETSERSFRGVLAVFLATAADDLSFEQRVRLYHLAGDVLTAEDNGAITALRILADEVDSAKGEEGLIRRTLELIENR